MQTPQADPSLQPAHLRSKTSPRLSILAALALLCLTLALLPSTASAQVWATVATGDASPKSKPTFPANCAPPIVATHTISTSATGRPEPTPPTSGTFMYDNSNILSAFTSTGCASGGGVELTVGPINTAFLIEPISIPAGITLIIDAGVTVFGSSDPCAYQVAVGGVVTCGTNSNSTSIFCGTVTNVGGGCNPLFTAATNTDPNPGSAIMGYGTIDGQGDNPLTNNEGVANTNQYYYSAGSNYHNSCPSTYVTWYCITQQSFSGYPYGLHNSPKMIYTRQSDDFALFKITLRDSPDFNVEWLGLDGQPTMTKNLTVWGVKILAPYWAENTDGIDPEDNIENVTIAYSFISNGDDNVAIDANSGGPGQTNYPAQNISVLHVNTNSGDGLSIGSLTQGTVSNVLYNFITQDGLNGESTNPPEYSSISSGFKIKSDREHGGLINEITYQNVCQENELYPFYFTPYVDPGSGDGHIPQFTDIYLHNVTVLANTNASYNSNVTTSLPNYFIFQGLSGYDTTMEMDNVDASAADVTLIGPSSLPYPYNQYTTIHNGPGQVLPDASSGANQLLYINNTANDSIDITEDGTPGTSTSYACSSASFQPLIGELFIDTSGADNTPQSTNNLNSATGAVGNNGIILTATIQAASEEYPALTTSNSVTFFETIESTGNTYQVGTSSITNNTASVTLNNVTAGTHSYFARYTDASGHYYSGSYYQFPVTASEPTFTVE